MNRDFSKWKRAGRQGFSLIEIAFALAVIGFSSMILLGLLPTGLATFHEAMSNTVEPEIVQSISNDLRLDNFSTLASYAAAPPTYYYDHDGTLLPGQTGSFYQAQVTFVPVTASNSPAALDPQGATTTSAYNITVTITNIAQTSSYAVQHPHLYSLIIANNGL
jgi:uncharacterized protein (TIGR02598 family)